MVFYNELCAFCTAQFLLGYLSEMFVKREASFGVKKKNNDWLHFLFFVTTVDLNPIIWLADQILRTNGDDCPVRVHFVYFVQKSRTDLFILLRTAVKYSEMRDYR